jgi:peptide-methionine (S)-S-oxide reductase
MARASSAAAVSILVALVLLVTAASGARLPARAGGGALPRGGGGGGVTATAVFALGSFWRSEAAFGCLPGVIRTSVGYAGGSKANPEYRNLADHAECVKVARELIPIHCAVVLVH